MKLKEIHENKELAYDDEVLLEGVGYNSLFNTECSVYFDRNKIQIDEAERYLEQYINNLDKEMVDKILHLACEWKNEQMNKLKIIQM